jgi:hypothetical protein
MNAASLPLLWANCIQRLKDRINNRSFWEAIELTQAITVEDDTLIIGLDALNFNHASHIQQSATLNTVQKTVEEYFGHPLKVRLIEGTTLADWHGTKERDAQVAVMRRSTEAKRVAESTQVSSWETLYEHLSRLLMQTPHRALPQGKARYANEALYTLMEAMDTLYPEPTDDLTERSLARMLERIALHSDIPASVLAFELERLRAWRKANPENS